MIATLLSVLLVAQDPRPQLVDLQQADRAEQALALSTRLLADDPNGARELGVEYLRGRLLERLGRGREAVSAYGGVLRYTPALRPWALYRIAAAEMDMGHPELAAGLLAALFRERVPATLLRDAQTLLAESLAGGGDCRVLTDSDFAHLPKEARRHLEVTRIGCEIEVGAPAGAPSELLRLLQEDASDLPAGLAADRYLSLAGSSLAPGTAALIGESLHEQRDFDRAVHYLELAAERLSPRLEGRGEFDTYYRLARSHFWLGDYEQAADSFGELAERTRRSAERARALYNRGRALELTGAWGDAADSYRRAYLAEPNGDFGGPSLFSALRIEWRTAREEAAQELAALLPTRRAWRREAGRAALFLAASDLVRGRSDRAGAWLEQADRSLGRDRLETLYWRGRLAELEAKPDRAVRQYFRVLVDEPHHPLADAARSRLRRPELRDTAHRAAVELAGSSRLDDLAIAWMVLGESHPRGAAAHAALVDHLERNRSARTFLFLGAAASDEWPIWEEALSVPEEKLLALGLWNEGNRYVLRHFPVSQPPLALAAGLGLAEDGNVRRSLYVGEILRKRISRDVADSLLPPDLRRLFYPYPFRAEIEAAARKYEVDPYLLLAIIREESRFDPTAVSPASARGLNQFVFPTAQRIARQIGLGAITPHDLQNPALSIELGAAYLAELGERFAGAEHRVVAAYNAGEAQTMLWQAYCYSLEPAEFLTKVGFVETRAYLARVLDARNQYAEIYSDAGGSAAVLGPGAW